MAARRLYDRTAVDAGALALPDKFSQVQRELLERMLRGYEAFRASNGHQEASILEARATILEFLSFADGIPGQVSEGDFERWCEHLLRAPTRHVRLATLRKYQANIRGFFNYLLRSAALRNDVHRTLDADIIQVATPDNCVVHADVKERTIDRRALSGRESQRFFAQIDQFIADAYTARCYAELKCWQRDKAMFTLMRTGGLRAAETTGCNTDSNEAAHSRKEMGEWGYVRVLGKGPKWRGVPLSEPDLPGVMDWYLSRVRPEFRTLTADAHRALFLSLKGNRLSYSALWKRFRMICEAADIPLDHSPHSMRHTSVTDDQLRHGISVHATKEKHGHEHAATTQGYTHLPSSFMEREYTKAMKRRFAERGVDDEDDEKSK